MSPYINACRVHSSTLFNRKKVTFTVFVFLPQSEHTEYLPLSLMGLDFDRFGKKGVCEGASGGGILPTATMSDALRQSKVPMHWAK